MRYYIHNIILFILYIEAPVDQPTQIEESFFIEKGVWIVVSLLSFVVGLFVLWYKKARRKTLILYRHDEKGMCN